MDTKNFAVLSEEEMYEVNGGGFALPGLGTILWVAVAVVGAATQNPGLIALGAANAVEGYGCDCVDNGGVYTSSISSDSNKSSGKSSK